MGVKRQKFSIADKITMEFVARKQRVSAWMLIFTRLRSFILFYVVKNILFGYNVRLNFVLMQSYLQMTIKIFNKTHIIKK